MPWNPGGYLRFPSLTWQSNPQVKALLRELSPEAKVVDLGAGGRRIAQKAICVDFLLLPGTNVVADVERLPFRRDSVDLVVATGLLEHVLDDRAVTAEVLRILRPGGLIHIELPFLQQHHEDPIDSRRYTVDGLARELERTGFEIVRSGIHIGPTVTLITLWTYYASLWFEGRSRASRAVSTAVFLGFSLLLYPFKFLDIFLRNKKSAYRLAFGVFCTARKRSPAAVSG